MTGEFIMAGHLGGYIAGGDPDTFYPELWQWMVKNDDMHVCSVLDVGCGDGATLRAFRKLGCHAEGIEGVEQDDALIYRHDCTTGPWESARHYDLVWCCEFVEHVEEQFIPNFLATFKAGRFVAMTHALPGQAGHHHVNTQNSGYWVERMHAAGFDLRDDLKLEARLHAHSYFLRTGMIFQNTASLR